MKWRRLKAWLFLGLGTLKGLTAVGAEPMVLGLRSPEISDRVQGHVLVSELGCANCHDELGARYRPKQGPDLSAIGARMGVSSLKALLANPSLAHPGTTMPDVLSALVSDERTAAIDSLAQFLASLQADESSAIASLESDSERGRELFHSIGCVACHAPMATESSYKGIANVEARHSLHSLVNYLRDPFASRPHSRMPDLHLDYQDAFDLAAFLLNGKLKAVEPVALDRQAVSNGAKAFEQLRCTACHQVGGLEFEPLTSIREISRPDAGCLSGERGGWPFYDLLDSQRIAIQSALRSDDELSSKEAIEVELRQFNCIACHERDGYGGPSGDLVDHFSGADLNLGDQGRLPPSLTGVGAKLIPSWLRRVVVEGAVSRPYLHTRMPRFQGAEIDALLERLGRVDQLEPVPSVPFAKLNDAKRVGRDLAGSEGLSCITCHTVKGAQVGAMGAIDLNLIGQRVTREWFHHYLRSPARFSPNTLMPAFWPGGVSSRPEVLEGKVEQQIEALWLYLLDGYGIGTPRGVRREPMQLLATEQEAVMLRRSYRGIGKRGIGVGYPSQVNLVYDAEQMCLAQLWTGPFLDPSGVWLSQGHGTARPLGKDVISFGGSPDLDWTSDIGTPRVVSGERNPERQFLGYTLDKKRRPTFEYRFRDVEVQDSFLDYRSEETIELLRIVSLNARDEVYPHVLRVARGDAITSPAEQRYEIDKRMQVKVEEGIASVVSKGEGQQELHVFPLWREGVGRIVVSYQFPL